MPTAELDQHPSPANSFDGETGSVDTKPIDRAAARWVSPPSVQLRDGTTLQLFRDGQALRAAYDAIEQAEVRIGLEVYIFQSDSTGRAFADLLAKKSRQGVRVYVIYDSFGSIDSDRSMFAMMRKSGVHLAEFHPLLPWRSRFGWRPGNRDHRKLLVIDNHLGGLGGLNIGAQYAGSSIIRGEQCEHWRDNAVGISGPGARMLHHAFARTWRYIHSGGRIRKAELISNLDSGELGLLASVPTLDSSLRPFLLRIFKAARHSIDLTMAYFAPDDDLIDQLCQAARRGVRVRLMLAGRCDIRLLRIAAQAFYERLMMAGIEVYERQCTVLHAKTIVIDQSTAILGSTNLDYRSIEYNCEISAIVRNETFAGQMVQLFDNDVEAAEKLDLRQWRRRPRLDRLTQWAVSRARYLL